MSLGVDEREREKTMKGAQANVVPERHVCSTSVNR